MSGRAGATVMVDIVRWENEEDNEIGGAMVTGSVIKENVSCSFTALKPTEQILQQGIGYFPTWSVSFRAAHVQDVKELDGFRIVGPTHHQYYDNYFRVISRDDSTIPSNQSRAHVRFWVQKVRYANANIEPG